MKKVLFYFVTVILLSISTLAAKQVESSVPDLSKPYMLTQREFLQIKIDNEVLIFIHDHNFLPGYGLIRAGISEDGRIRAGIYINKNAKLSYKQVDDYRGDLFLSLSASIASYYYALVNTSPSVEVKVKPLESYGDLSW